MRLGVATVQRWLRRKRESGSVAAKRQGGGFSPKIDEEGIAYLRAELAETPDLSLEDLAQRYTKNRHVSVSRSAVLRALQRSGITRKKTWFATEQTSERVEELRASWRFRMTSLPADSLLFIDESASRCDMALAYGRGLRGQRIKAYRSTCRGENITMIGALSLGVSRPS